jgi:hypothetical protein
VRITFTDTSVPARSYHILEIGAFLLADPAAASPLRIAHEEWLREGQRTDEAILLHFLGDRARMTPAEREAALGLPKGERLVRDMDGDGDADLADFLDTDPRHTVRPMLVRVIDDDDDMHHDGYGDRDSDFYVADWHGDGRIDRAVDYWDDDGDGDPDRMDIYYAAGTWHCDDVEVVVIRDIGDDNRLWYTRNYEYQQRPCQWQSDFNGDEMFCMFRYDRGARRFVPDFEDPFTHHDLDGDGVAEMTIRFVGHGQTIRTLRYSFDADNDTNAATNRRDYDFSFNCVGQIAVPEEQSTRDTLRNGEPTQRYLDWPFAREFAEAADWKSCRLCWDETDNNVNPARGDEREHERWEGVGGYPMREGNKRWETDADYSGTMQLYYWPLDRRLHLLGAETGYMDVDYDHDSRIDARITYADEDGDGFFDSYSYDTGADGDPEHNVKTTGVECEMVPIEYEAFVRRYRAWVHEALSANEALIAALHGLLGDQAASRIENWWTHERPDGYYAAEKLARSREARRYYTDLIREELFLLARERFGEEPWWAEFERAYDAAEYRRAAAALGTRHSQRTGGASVTCLRIEVRLTLIACMAVVVLLAAAQLGAADDPAAGPVTVDADFPGGNIVVERIEGDEIFLHQDLRDTRGDWFWWYFRVRGAAGRSLTIHFTKSNVIGVRGPAVSTDGGETWSWLGADAVKGQSFRCAVPEDAAEARFCFAIPYTEANLHQFVGRCRGNEHLRVQGLCTTRKGRDVERLHVGRLDGDPKYRVLITARHHACECMANYAAEGLLQAALADTDDGKWLRERVELMVVPFMDRDGVGDGDQGKNRKPHDHNRDYEGESIYPSVRALRELVPKWSQGSLRVALDLHCPHIRGPSNEVIYLVGSSSSAIWEQQQAFGELLEAACSGPLRYQVSDNLPFGKGWNTGKNYAAGKSCSRWASELPGVRLASTIEIPYANVAGSPTTPESARAFGRDLARTIRRYLEREE